jgi:hypothetical protein
MQSGLCTAIWMWFGEVQAQSQVEHSANYETAQVWTNNEE